MKCSCPNCQRSLSINQTLPAQIHCPHCNATFLMDAATFANASKAAPTMSMRPVSQAAPKTDTIRRVVKPAAETVGMRPVMNGQATTPSPVARTPAIAPPPAGTLRTIPPWVTSLLLGGFGLFLLGGMAIAIYCFTVDGSNSGSVEQAQTTTPPLSLKTGLVNRGIPPKKNDREVPKDQSKKQIGLPGTQEKVNEKKADPKVPLSPVEKIKEPEGPPKLKIKVIETVTKAEKVQPRKLLLAVSEAAFDDMGKLLESLGKGYQEYTTFTERELENLALLKKYDVLFLTCRRTDPQNIRLKSALRQFVEDGGTLYASDLRFDALVAAFPEFIEIKRGREGAKQTLTVNVVDPGLRELLGVNMVPPVLVASAVGFLGSPLEKGSFLAASALFPGRTKKIDLHFDQAGWKPATFKRNKVTVYMEGNFRAYPHFGQKKNQHFEEPLLVKFNCKKGSVIFTSFHNAKQNSEVEEKLLRYLVFTAVTSFEETRVATTMVEGGFSPQPTRRLAASDEAPSATQTYHNKRAGRLQFALGFSNSGAKLRLELVAPGGQKVVRVGTATFVVEVDNAAAGDWRYTVTALRVPYPNFPFTLAVGESVPK